MILANNLLVFVVTVAVAHRSA